MERYVKKRKIKRRRLIVLSVLLLILLSVWGFMSFFVNPVIRTVSEESVKALTIEAVNNAAADVMNSNPAFVELIEVTKDNNGKITLIQANTVLINMLARNTTLEAQKNISKMGEQGITVPIGSLTGIAIMAGRGPSMTMRVLPVGSISTEFRSQFTSAGINQTRHRIYMEVKASISIVVPGLNNTVETVTEVLISESLIIGEVPEFYFNTSSLDDLLNLVP